MNPASPSPVTMFVIYRGTAETRFDREYYVNGHLPLVMNAWRQYGLLEIAAFFPPAVPAAGAEAGTIAICECRFRDEAAMSTAFSSPELPAVMADLSNYSDVKPTRVRAVAP